ncbi:hypothetical protein HMN09_01041800 [Mycena chlorophos]|uniref:Uncharacterized protein n=1 Tax=Mycena chlorophos TaxID=658473 RepID=A0A8H6VXY9_MYCCL|nr:hypothetical protein HMN09_01041800 [Mycena chlorophos]
MSALDRLYNNVHAISTATASTSHPRPFTNAILSAPLADLIRDTDPSEDGLFTSNLKRVEFHGPAPRRKQDPEIYAEAALSYIQQYNHIRPMPRAYARVSAILDQLDATRESIRSLTETLEQVQPSELKPLADKEEQRVAELQATLADLKKRKERQSVRAKPATALTAPRPPTTPVKSVSNLDEEFHTPAAAARTMRFTDNLLMDEHEDLADISVSSPVMPMRTQRPVTPPDESVMEPEVESEADQTTSTVQEDDTITLPRPPTSVAPSPPPESPVKPVASETPKKGKVRVNSEVERLAAKIWSTVGDLIMPGHQYDTSGSGTGKKPPHAKETIAHLKSVAALIPAPPSPSTTISSITAPGSTAPTPQQIMTAHMLLALLESGPPAYSLPLNKVRELLSAKASTAGGAGIFVGGQNTTRVLYACVAKRLVKIERGGGEELVKFDL